MPLFRGIFLSRGLNPRLLHLCIDNTDLYCPGKPQNDTILPIFLFRKVSRFPKHYQNVLCNRVLSIHHSASLVANTLFANVASIDKQTVLWTLNTLPLRFSSPELRPHEELAEELRETGSTEHLVQCLSHSKCYINAYQILLKLF